MSASQRHTLVVNNQRSDALRRRHRSYRLHEQRIRGNVEYSRSVGLGGGQIECALGDLFKLQTRPPYLSETDDRAAASFVDAVKLLSLADNVRSGAA